MVNLDISEGFLESFQINWGDLSSNQRLDYKGFPFYCRIFHDTDHVKSDCKLGIPYSYGKKQWRKNMTLNLTSTLP